MKSIQEAEDPDIKTSDDILLPVQTFPISRVKDKSKTWIVDLYNIKFYIITSEALGFWDLYWALVIIDLFISMLPDIISSDFPFPYLFVSQKQESEDGIKDHENKDCS